MAKNDAILLDGIIQEIMDGGFYDRGEAFELFAFRQILKSYDLTQDELYSGWVDGRNDGGVDGFYTFINGVLLQNIHGYVWPKKNVSIDIWIINCKSDDSFKQAPLNTIFPTVEELLDFTKEPSDFEGHYSDQLIRARQIAVQAFLRTACALPSMSFNFAYASRGDLLALEGNVDARGNQIKRIVNDYFSAASVSLDFFGATELIELHRKNRIVLQLPYVEQLCREQSAYVLLVQIDAYAKFVSDEHGQLRRYLFDSNVRDFLGENRVNLDIYNSLIDKNSPDFWWMNNGVTILATSAIPLGKTQLGNAIQLHDVQIVNGLQTTQSIYNYFKTVSATANNRCVLIKVIVSEDEAVRDGIIQATNNQSQVELAALNATDKIQRDIEDILERHQWYYERRKNYYKNIGKPADRFITPLFLAVALIALVKKSPNKAGTLKTRFMRNAASYEAVFSDMVSIELWPKLAEVLKKIESHMISAVPRLNATGSRNLGKWRGAVALCSVAKLKGTFAFNQQELLEIDENCLTAELVVDIFTKLKHIHAKKYVGDVLDDMSNNRIKKRLGNIDAICSVFGNQEGIAQTELIGRWLLPSDGAAPVSLNKNIESSGDVKINVSDEIVKQVAAILPNQPWPPGIQDVVCKQLGLNKRVVRRAINRLIEDGEFNNQWTGVVVNQEGNIVAVDAERADPKFIVGKKYPGR